MALTLMENFRTVKQANSESVFQVSIFYRQMGHPIIGIGADVNDVVYSLVLFMSCSGLQMVQVFKLFFYYCHNVIL